MSDNLQTMGSVNEVTRLAGAGGGSAAFAAVVQSNYAYNIYMVRVAEILLEGMTPAEIGDQLKAVNLAEDFTQAGQLAAGKCVLVCTTADKYIFYAEP